MSLSFSTGLTKADFQSEGMVADSKQKLNRCVTGMAIRVEASLRAVTHKHGLSFLHTVGGDVIR